MILKDGRTNVALLSGCLCFLTTTFSLAGAKPEADKACGGVPASGNPTVRLMGDPVGVTVGDTALFTNLLNPSPILPPSAFRVPPTAAETLPGEITPLPGDPRPEGPAPEEDEPASSESKKPRPVDVPEEGPPTTFAAKSRSRLPSVGLGGGGGGLRIPLVGGLGRRRAGERGAFGVAGACSVEDEGVEDIIGMEDDRGG